MSTTIFFSTTFFCLIFRYLAQKISCVGCQFSIKYSQMLGCPMIPCVFSYLLLLNIWWKVSVSKTSQKWFSSSSKFVKYSFQFSTIAYISFDCIFRSTNVYILCSVSLSWNWIEFTRFPLELFYYLDWVQFYVKLSWIFWFCCCGEWMLVVRRRNGLDWGVEFWVLWKFFLKVSFPLYIESISN